MLNIAQNQIKQCVEFLVHIFGKDLLGMYLYGSSIVGGLQKYSDIDLYVVCARPATSEEKIKIVKQLLTISGVYMKGEAFPIELTIVEKSQINPWRYPPKFDFQYGEWLRSEFESGNCEPWSTQEMPDLALLITQILLASKTLIGSEPHQILCKVPYPDFIRALKDSMQNIIVELDADTRNVLLTLARIWSTVATDKIRSKPAAADWVLSRLPEKCRPVMEKAKAISQGEEKEYWGGLQEIIKDCAVFMINQINTKITEIQSSDYSNRSISLAN